MSTSLTRDEAIKGMVKLALEFNAGILALCTAYFGNMDDPKNQKKFFREYDRMRKEYDKGLKRLEQSVIPDDESPQPSPTNS